MFIAVVPYKSQTRMISDKITVFDTEDCTVEIISFDSYKNSNITIMNIDPFTKSIALSMIKILLESINDYVRYGDHGVYIGDLHIRLYSNGIQDMYDGFNHAHCDLMYLFKFKDYIIFRLKARKQRDWYSACVSIKGVVLCIWNNSFTYYYGDKSIALKIDMLSEV